LLNGWQETIMIRWNWTTRLKLAILGRDSEANVHAQRNKPRVALDTLQERFGPSSLAGVASTLMLVPTQSSWYETSDSTIDTTSFSKSVESTTAINVADGISTTTFEALSTAGIEATQSAAISSEPIAFAESSTALAWTANFAAAPSPESMPSAISPTPNLPSVVTNPTAITNLTQTPAICPDDVGDVGDAGDAVLTTASIDADQPSSDAPPVFDVPVETFADVVIQSSEVPFAESSILDSSFGFDSVLIDIPSESIVPDAIGGGTILMPGGSSLPPIDGQVTTMNPPDLLQSDPGTLEVNRIGVDQADSPLPKVAAGTVKATSTTAGDSFRIARVDASSNAVSVAYTVTGFHSGIATQTHGTATIPAGQREAIVQAGTDAQGRAFEVAVMTLHDNGQFESTKVNATLFANGNPMGVGEPSLFEAFRQSQSQDAFNELVGRHRAGVFRTCYQILGNWADAEDVGQFVFLAFAQQQLKFNSTVSGWLQKVARNASIALLRAKARRLHYEREAAMPDVAASYETNFDLRDELNSAMKEISSPLRDAVRLRYLEGWSQNEAAEIVGVPRGTLSQRASQGVQELRSILLENDAYAG
jgi:RNA polymerase sigma factor (sigma-70 family)